MAKEPENDIDSLARMVADGFKSMREDMSERFEEIGKDMSERLADMGKDMNGRFDSLEKEVHTTNQHIDRVVMPMLDEHSRRIKDLEVRVS